MGSRIHKTRFEAIAKGKRHASFDDVEDEDDEEVVGVEDDKKKKGITRRGSIMGGGAPVFCQAEKCTIDLAEAKRYYRRHKVCEPHSKAPMVIVGGARQRFCQQCSRFHELSEFDDTKRSCRRRLAGHNERRRKNSSEFQGEGSGNKLRGGNEDHPKENHYRQIKQTTKNPASLFGKLQAFSDQMKSS